MVVPPFGQRRHHGKDRRTGQHLSGCCTLNGPASDVASLGPGPGPRCPAIDAWRGAGAFQAGAIVFFCETNP